MQLVPSNSKILRTPTKKISVKQGRETGRAMLKFLARHNRLHPLRKGVGLAAPQVGLGVSVCVFPSFSAYPEGLILINPTIISSCEVKLEQEESCLSLPGASYLVERHVWVELQADNFPDETIHFGPMPGMNWDAQSLLESRCVQHELNHLDGILIDSISRKDTNVSANISKLQVLR